MDQDYSTKKKGGHLKFRIKLTSELITHSSSFKHASLIDEFGVRINLKNHIITIRNGYNRIYDIIIIVWE
jgi:hypothetical protein